MTTLVMKSKLASKAHGIASALLGSHQLKVGRHWYKGQHHCDLVVLRQEAAILIQASGNVRFRMDLWSPDPDEMQGKLVLIGWLREAPNAMRIVMEILGDHAQDVLRRREHKHEIELRAAAEGAPIPEFTEAIGSHFSIKADEDKLEAIHRIDRAHSDLNFELALRSRWYHKSFVSFCQQQGLRCHYRPASVH